jgi:hypothetical protein
MHASDEFWWKKLSAVLFLYAVNSDRNLLNKKFGGLLDLQKIV